MKISNITKVVTGGTPSTKNNSYWENGTIPWLQSGVCKNGYVDTCSKYITQAGLENSAAKIMPAGTVIIALTGATVGKVGIMRIDACANQSVTGILPNEKFLPQYLFYYLMSIRGKIIHDSYGDAQPHISQQYVKDIDVPLPSIPEQERIISHIEELFSQLDTGVETLKKVKAQLSVYRDAVLKDTFEGNYPRKHLKEISKAISGYAFKSSKYSPDGKYIVVKIGNVKERHFDFSRDLTLTTEADDVILEKYLLHRGDCLITLTGSRAKRDYGFVAMIEDQTNYLLNQRVAALRFDMSVALPEFFQYYLASLTYRNQFFSYETGNVGQGNVGIKALTEPLVVVPDMDTQKKIVEEIESRLSVCDSIEQAVNSALQQAEALRQSILKAAFEGRL